MPNVTSVWDFSPGETLTAAKLDDVNCGIHVFSGTATRDAAYGGSGERTLAEGEFAYLADSNTTQYYDGSAWQSLTPGMKCVKAETSFSAASSVTADSVFTSDFTNYVVVIRYSTSTTNLPYLKLRTGGVSASTAYDYQTLAANDTTVSGARLTNQTSFIYGYSTNSASEKFVSTITLAGPNLAEATAIRSESGGTVGSNAALSYYITGNHRTATAYDGIEFLVATGTMTGTYTIYGLSKVV
jgi:hypothetical protein